MLTRLFSESLFPRRLAPETEQRLRLAQARAEDALIRTHVTNALQFVDLLASEVGFERAIDVYIRELALPEALADVVANRVLVTLGDTMIVPSSLPETTDGTASAVPPSELRLDEAARRRRA